MADDDANGWTEEQRHLVLRDPVTAHVHAHVWKFQNTHLWETFRLDGSGYESSERGQREEGAIEAAEQSLCKMVRNNTGPGEIYPNQFLADLFARKGGK